jgi:hypothetical protein
MREKVRDCDSRPPTSNVGKTKKRCRVKKDMLCPLVNHDKGILDRMGQKDSRTRVASPPPTLNTRCHSCQSCRSIRFIRRAENIKRDLLVPSPVSLPPVTPCPMNPNIPSSPPNSRSADIGLQLDPDYQHHPTPVSVVYVVVNVTIPSPPSSYQGDAPFTTVGGFRYSPASPCREEKVLGWFHSRPLFRHPVRGASPPPGHLRPSWRCLPFKSPLGFLLGFHPHIPPPPRLT